MIIRVSHSCTTSSLSLHSDAGTANGDDDVETWWVGEPDDDDGDDDGREK